MTRRATPDTALRTPRTVLRRKPERGSHDLRTVEVITEHLSAGRWAEVRGPTAVEPEATMVLRLPIDEASAKVRAGGPIDDEADMSPAVWAGVVPHRLVAGDPIADTPAADLKASRGDSGPRQNARWGPEKLPLER